MTPPETDIAALRDTLTELRAMTRSLSVRLEFRRPQAVKFSSAVAFRGLLGDVLFRDEPEMARTFFKPDSDGFTPPPLAIRLMRDSGAGGELFDHAEFVISVLSRDRRQPERLAELIRARFPGAEFGASGISAAQVTVAEAEEIAFSEAGPEDLFRVSLDFRTPVRIKRHGIIIDPRSFSPAFVASALLERLNAFSAAYGSGAAVPTTGFVARAALLPIREKEIRYRTQQRTSGNTGQKIHLSGCVGTMVMDRCPADLVWLFHWGSHFGVGRHTSAGGGMYRFHAERL